MQPASRHRDILAVMLTIPLLELYRTAWISDDAAITLRCVLNLLHGYGATFNIAERVQPYTHPLWFALLSAATLVTRNVFAATFLLSAGVSFACFWLLLTRVTRNFGAGVLAASALILSKAYVDFSTSGLENPLAHLLILLAVIAVDLRWFFLICSLLYLTRPDLLILVMPLAWLVIAQHRSSPRVLIRSMAVGALPAIAWTLFSLYYYGFPFPNTAYAKLGAGIPLDERIVQGGKYLADSLSRDFVTLPFLACGIVLGLRASRVEAALSLGSLLYLAFVVSMGGDFMSGRFLTAALLVSAIVVSRSALSIKQLRVAGAVLVLLAIPTLDATLLSGPNYSDSRIGENGIADERGYYFRRYGFITAPENTFAQPAWTPATTSVSVVCGNLGFTGMFEGPGAHLIDECALSDPLLAHLPAERTGSWRIGHFKRQLPTDYEWSIEHGENRLADARTREYYEVIRRVTRGPLLSVERMRDVVRLNLGLVPAPDWNMYYATKVPRISAVDSTAPRSTSR